MGDVALFLSPHLDDAVLSCSGYIQRLARDGLEVVIATVFTRADAAHEPLYRNRRNEDRQAASLLGVSVKHLRFLDAPYRSPAYRDFRGIGFGRAREYPSTCRAVAREIARLARTLQPCVVVAPLAVGNHVDHRLVRDASLAARELSGLLFYEDRPYAFVREQVRHVLGRNLGSRPARFWRRYFNTPYIRSYLGATEPVSVVRDWARAPPFPPEYSLRGALTVTMNRAELGRAIAAIQAYGSQFADLFTGVEELRALYEALPETMYQAARRR